MEVVSKEKAAERTEKVLFRYCKSLSFYLGVVPERWMLFPITESKKTFYTGDTACEMLGISYSGPFRDFKHYLYLNPSLRFVKINYTSPWNERQLKLYATDLNIFWELEQLKFLELYLEDDIALSFLGKGLELELKRDPKLESKRNSEESSAFRGREAPDLTIILHLYSKSLDATSVIEGLEKKFPKNTKLHIDSKFGGLGGKYQIQLFESTINQKAGDRGLSIGITEYEFQSDGKWKNVGCFDEVEI